MITYPSTHGVFESSIKEITRFEWPYDQTRALQEERNNQDNKKLAAIYKEIDKLERTS